jgi:hypothetical protein
MSAETPSPTNTTVYDDAATLLLSVTKYSVLSPFIAIYLAVKSTYQLIIRAPEFITYAMTWTDENILTPIGHGLVWLVDMAADAAEWTYENILTPLGHGLIWLVDMAADVAEWPYEHVLTPIGHGIADITIWAKDGVVFASEWTYENIFTPIGHFTVDSMIWTYGYILTPIGHATMYSAVWTYSHVLTPAGHFIVDAAIGVKDYVLVPSATAAGDIAISVKDGVVYAAESIGHQAYEASHTVYVAGEYAFNSAYDGVQQGAHDISDYLNSWWEYADQPAA